MLLFSVSVMTYIENEVSVYKMSLVGTKGLAVFQGTLAKPVSRQQVKNSIIKKNFSSKSFPFVLFHKTLKILVEGRRPPPP